MRGFDLGCAPKLSISRLKELMNLQSLLAAPASVILQRHPKIPPVGELAR